MYDLKSIQAQSRKREVKAKALTFGHKGKSWAGGSGLGIRPLPGELVTCGNWR